MNLTIEKAEKLIGGVLAELEKDTGSVVKDLSVIDIVVTEYHQDRQQLARRVQIELERLPGTKWRK